MAIHDKPKRKRAKAHHVARAVSTGPASFQFSGGAEMHFELIVPDAFFHATTSKPTSCTLSTRGGDTRRAILTFI